MSRRNSIVTKSQRLSGSAGDQSISFQAMVVSRGRRIARKGRRRSRSLLSRVAAPGPDGRALATSNLLSTVGTGIFLTGATVFFVRYASLSVPKLSLGLTVAGLVALMVSLPIGLLSDRIGSRETAIAMLCLRASATASFVLVHSEVALIIAASVALSAERGGQAAFGALTAQVGGADKVRLRAYLRSVANIGISLGAGISGILIADSSRAAYAGLMLTDAAMLFTAVLALLRVQTGPRATVPHGTQRLSAVRDVPYLAATGLHGLLNLNYDILGFALPLWLITHTTVPRWFISVLVVLNTILVVLFQVPASRGISTARRAGIVGRRSGGLFLVACGLVALTSGEPRSLSTALLVAAVMVLTLGELWHAAASFTLSFELAQEHAHGQYQAVYAAGDALERALAPLVLGTLCIAWGQAGWLCLGAAFACGGALLPAIVRAADRRGQPGRGVVGAEHHGTTESGELVAQIAAGNIEAPMTELYRRYSGRLYSFGIHELGNTGLAEKMVQESYVRLWRMAGGFDASRISVSTYLSFIARSVAANIRKQPSSRPLLPVEKTDASSQAESIDQIFDGLIVHEALGTLNPAHLQVLRLTQNEGLTQSQIAVRLGLPLGTVKLRMFYGMRVLLATLAERVSMPPDAAGELGHPETAAWALGALDPEQAKRFKAHLQSCGGCRIALVEFEHVARALAHPPPAAEPPPDLQVRTVASVQRAVIVAKRAQENLQPVRAENAVTAADLASLGE